MEISNRIFFKDNPYPNGHKIKNFVWSGRLDPDKGLWFDFHLETEDYYAEDESEEEDDETEPESDWKAKNVWGNYHSCTISSTKWHFGGILVGNENNKLDFANLASKTIFADKLPLLNDWDYEDLCFHIYLLGHDSCADHQIKFLEKHVDNSFDIHWQGKIAQTYIGDYEFTHEFTANLENIKFAGFEIPKEFTSSNEIEKLLEKFVSNKEIYKIADNKIYLK